MEYVKHLENEKVAVFFIKLMPHEETDYHYDKHPQVVIAVEGGTLTRLEADGSSTFIEFPTGKAVFRPSETAAKLHKTVNGTEDTIALMVIQLL